MVIRLNLPRNSAAVPYCYTCGTCHNITEPHAMTSEFVFQFRAASDRMPTMEDTYSHCRGLMRAAAELGAQAMAQRGAA